MDVQEIIKQYSSGKRNFSGVNLAYSDLCKVNLKEINLESASLKEANISEADLTGANLSNINLENADLRHANLKGANLSNAILRGASLRGADLTDAIMKGANLELADLREAIAPNLQGTLKGAKLKSTKISKQGQNAREKQHPIKPKSPRVVTEATKKKLNLQPPNNTQEIKIPPVKPSPSEDEKSKEIKPTPVSGEVKEIEQKSSENHGENPSSPPSENNEKQEGGE